MRHYQLEYSAKNVYEKQVWGAYLKFMVHPYSAIGAQIYPPVFKLNVDGNWWMSASRQKNTNEIFFTTSNKFTELEVQYSSLVIVPEINPFNREWLTIEAENAILTSTDWIINNYSFIYLSAHRPKSYLEIKDCEGFSWSEKGALLDKIIDLRDQVYNKIAFITGVTNTETCALEVLQLKKGVCQDFVHLYLALLRNFGVACRYTSGYLHEGEGIRGASQLHAWVECHVPNVGWIGIDPTNQLLCDHNYIKICHGYDYDDCLPVSGVVNSLAQNQSSEYQVKVQQIQ